jgi:predicted glycosyltransferase involved in capsule biosynthesis
MYPLKHVRIDSAPNGPFNKSKIFNAGVALLDADAVVLHDADTMAPGSYTNKVYRVLQEYESCHLCTRVYYANGQSTLNINKSGKVVAEDLTCDRYVGYFEGGSLACTVDAYWRIGGFYEAYEGYGCEDCDFYLRLSKNTQWLEDRTVNLLHLHHGRSGKWRDYHKLNKALESKLARLTMSERIKKARNALKSGPHARFIK